MHPTRRGTARVTIQDVAKQAGVSVMTVSNVVNRLPIVKMATRDRVLAVIEDLGYVPSQTARRLNGSIASRIGLIYFGQDLPLMDSFLSKVAIAAADRGLQLVMRKVEQFYLPDLTDEVLRDLTHSLMRSGAQGLLLFPPFDQAFARSAFLHEIDIPLVALEAAMALPGISTFRIDDRAAARAITELLIARGRRRIATITGPADMVQSRERFEGYREAMHANGLDVIPELCLEGQFTFESGLIAATRLLGLPERPDAIVATNDDMAAAVLLAGHRLGLDMPRELAVTGFDDTLIATRVWPALTTVRQPVEDMTRQALDHLVDAIRKRVPDERDVILDFTIVERESV